MSLNELGLNPLILKQFSRIFAHRKGLFIFTGPFASGKTTTLYSFIASLATRKRIVTLEEKIRCQIPDVHQVEWRSTDESTLPYYIRNLAPEVLVVIVPIKTQTLFQLATMSLVLTKMPLATGLDVLAYLGTEIQDSHTFNLLQGVLSQRRLRQLCPHCRTTQNFTEEDKVRYGQLPLDVFYMSQGCPQCQETGYIESNYLYELLLGTNNMAQSSAKELMIQNRKNGGINLKDEALEKLKNGLISFEDAVRLIYT